MFRIYSNENVPKGTVQALRAKGCDVLTSLEAGNANQRIPDDEVLAYAVENRRIMLTINRRDFAKLHREYQAEEKEHEGIILISVDSNFSRQADQIFQALSNVGNVVSQLLRVNRPS